jgi:hypothetical protein
MITQELGVQAAGSYQAVYKTEIRLTCVIIHVGVSLFAISLDTRADRSSLISEKVYAPTPWPASVLRSVGGTTWSLLFSSTSQQIIPPEVDLPGDILMCRPAQLRSYGHSKTAWPMPRRTARNIKRDIAPTNRVTL